MMGRIRFPAHLPVVALLVMLVITGAVIVVADEDGYTYGLSNCLSKSKYVEWMKDMPDNTRILRGMTIPGTHDSGSFEYKLLVAQQCQCSTIKQQLEAGVRFIDFRVAFIGNNMRLAHGRLPTMEVTASFEDAMAQVSNFLTEHPSEVIVARIQREAAGWLGSKYDWKADIMTELINRYDDIIDRDCFDDGCVLGYSRGKIIFLSFGSEFWPYSFMKYMSLFGTIQDESSLTSFQAYHKYELIRSNLIAASQGDEQNSIINFISAGAYATPYFFASGKVLPKGPALWTGLTLACFLPLSSTFIDFPRRFCTCAKKASICSVFNRGMNAMLYEWIDNGLNGRPQSREADYVFPKHLGILPMDFPSNGLIDKVIEVNFAKAPSPPANKRIEFVCGGDCACIAGDTRIETKSSGLVAARNVETGDSIKGADDQSWCKVLKVAQVESNGTVYGDFTKDHFVVVGNTVTPSGTSGSARSMDLVNIATDCAATRTSDGALFTPISEVFCTGNMSWSTYAVVYQALMRIVARTGAFWFDPSIYVQDPTGANSSVGMEDGQFSEQTWSAQLPSICSALSSCVSGGAECDEFEKIAADWMSKHLPSETYAFVQTVYPNLGIAAAKDGNLLEDVRAAHKSTLPTAAIVVIAVVGAAIVVAIAIAVWYRCFRHVDTGDLPASNTEKATGNTVTDEEAQSESVNTNY